MATGRVPTTANSPLTAKGDLFTYSTAPARLAVGNNGEQIVADSSTATGLSYQANWAAGKNKLINADMAINQRNFSSGTAATFVVDRWQSQGSGGTVTRSVQSFTPGTAPVAGYEAANFLRTITASQSANGDYAGWLQSIEDVRTFANQTITVSFWAKASTGTPKVGITSEQNFGSGGSAATYTSNATTTISTSWARYSVTLTIPSISGKTIGTSSFNAIWLFSSCGSTISALGYPAIGLQNTTIDIWGVQAEAGSVATAFQTATGTIQGELAACQRYYYRLSAATGQTNFYIGAGTVNASGNNAYIYTKYPTTMRVVPTFTFLSAGNYYIVSNPQGVATGVGTDNPGVDSAGLTFSKASMTAYASATIQANSASAYIEMSAEL